MLTSILFILLFPWRHALAFNCHDKAYSQQHFHLKGHVIKSFSSTSTKEQCKKKCSSHQNCNSINFYHRKMVCELNSANHMSNPESLLPSSDSHYMDFKNRYSTKCNHKLCIEPLACEMNGNEYNCVPCEGKKEVLNFPRKSISDYVLLENGFSSSLSSFTFAVWLQAVVGSDLTPASYASPSVNEEFLFYLTPTYTEFMIGSYMNKDSPPITDNKWHHLCLTWENTEGSFKMYMDGIVTAQGNSIRTGNTIPQGALVVGQEQDSYKGSFSQDQSFEGNISSVNLWDRVFAAQEVLTLSKSCPTQEGNLIRWSNLIGSETGSTAWICAPFCY